MERNRPLAASIDDYIAECAPEVQAILQQIRRTVHEAAPEAQEAISYQIPSFRLNGVLVYFAAFKKHIGFFPPVTGDVQLKRALAPYAGPGGNLRFPLDRPIPYELIGRIARLRVRQDLKQAVAKKAKKARRART